MQMLIPLLINRIITYVSDPNRDFNEGVYLVATIAGSRIVAAFT
jgi:hypothetical protein